MRIRCLVDSGSFVIWKKGRSVDIQEYIAYLKRNADWIEYAVNLDVIPGKWGQTPTSAQVEQSAQQSFKNYQIMKDAGVPVIPVFHQNEDFRWLLRYMDDGCDYIGISPSSDTLGWRGADPTVWLDRVFSITTDCNGYPLIKTHAFGATGHGVMMRYPWTTCDSTSYTQLPNYGKILVPRYKRSEPNYLLPPIYVHVSDVTARDGSAWSSAKDKAKDQFGNLGPQQQDHVIHFVTKVCNLTMTEIKYDDNERRKAVITYWQLFANALGDNVQFKHRIRNFKI